MDRFFVKAAYDDPNVDYDDAVVQYDGGETRTWSAADTAPWSTTSGGAGGASVPGSADVAIFDNNSPSCTVDVGFSVDVSGINVQGGGTAFTNTLDFNDNSIIIGAGNFVFAAGNLNLGNGTIFSSGDVTVSGGTLNAESGTWQFDNPGAGGGTITGTFTLNNFTCNHNDTQDRTQTISGTVTVLGNLVFSNSSSGGYTVNGGTIKAKGNVTFDDQRYPGTTTILIDGTGAQAFSAAHTASFGNTPNVTINKSSGTLTISGTIRVTGNWTVTTGTLNATGTVVFGSPGIAGKTITGSHTLNNVTFDQNDTQTRTWTINSGDTLTVTGTLTLDNSNPGPGLFIINDGTIEAKGNISVATPFGGTATILINGTSAQSFSGTHTNTSGGIPILIINKASGTLTMTGTIRTGANWTHTAGDLDSSAVSVVFADPGGAGGTITGSHTLGNIRFDHNNGQIRTWTINAGDTLTASGAIVIDNSNVGGSAINVNTGTLEGKGNITYAVEAGGNAATLISGTSAQNISFASAPSGTIIVTNTAGIVACTANFVATATGQDLVIGAGVTFCSGGNDVTVDDLITNNGTFQKFVADTISPAPAPNAAVIVLSCGAQPIADRSGILDLILSDVIKI